MSRTLGDGVSCLEPWRRRARSRAQISVCGLGACEGGVWRRVVVCSARRSARVVRGLLCAHTPMSRLSEPARVPAPAGRRKGLAAFDASSLWGYHVSVPAAFGLLPARHLASMELTNCCSMKEEVSIETRVSSGASWHQQQLLFCTRHG